MGQELVPNDLCIGEDRPRNTKKCEEKSCLQYSWTVGNWSEVRFIVTKFLDSIKVTVINKL